MNVLDGRKGRPLAATRSAVAASTFRIGETEFLLDGAPFVIRCGEIHFPRVPREYWRHRLRMCRALGLNAVCVYLFWGFHEWEEGRYDWSGQAAAQDFCRMAQEEGLWVLLRPGPYSCAEWEMGGLPWWLTKREGIRLRSTDPLYMKPATDYLHEVGRVLAPLQITRGGPILMTQVENEYGSFGNDPNYMGALKDALRAAGFDVPLFACDPPGDLKNGYREDIFQVVNFGSGASKNAFSELRKIQKSGPLMNGEYYPAWFDMWGRRHRTGATETVVADLRYMLEHRHSFSVYMAHGGTSFGLWAGADRPFSPTASSYDYDAPISEAGWVTPKFNEIRALMLRHLEQGETLPDPPDAKPVIEIPAFTLQECAPLFENLPAPIQDLTPKPMELYDQSRGATVYRTTLPAGPAATLSAEAVHDFGWAFLDGVPIGVMDRRTRSYALEIPDRKQDARLDLLVYAMGRVNFGNEVLDRKGLHGPIHLNEQELEGWEIFQFPLSDSQLDSLQYGPATNGPAFWRGHFDLEVLGDTFLDVRNWGKGVVWINGQALGRYWNIGPTQTMYLPAPWLRKGRNEIVILDLLGPSVNAVCGLVRPILDELRTELDFSRRKRATGNLCLPPPVAEGTFNPSPNWQEALFQKVEEGRFLCLEAVNSQSGGAGISAAELDVIGTSNSKTLWKIHWVSSEETNYFPGDAEHAIDGQNATSWHTERDIAGPHQIVIDLGECLKVDGIRYLPTPGEGNEGRRIKEYQVYLSEEPFGLQGNL